MQPAEDRDQLIPKSFTSSDQLQRAHDFLKAKLDSAYLDHKNRSNFWHAWDKSYRLIDEQKPDEGAAVVDPEIQVIVDTLTANEVEAFLGQDPPFEFKGTEETDEEQAAIMTAYIHDDLTHIKLREKLERSIRQKKVFGTAIVKTPYVSRSKKRKVRRVVERTPKPDGTFKVKTEVQKVDFNYFNGTDWEYVSIFDFYPVGRGTDVQEIEGVIQIFEKTYDQLYDRRVRKEGDEEVGIYRNLDTIARQPGKKLKVAEYWGRIPKSIVTGNIEDSDECFEGLITAVIDAPENEDERRRQRQIHSERTGQASDTEDDAFLEASAGLRFQENPFWDNERPFLICPEIPIENEIYGMGVIEPLVEKAQELNTTIRQVLDNKTLQLLNPTIEDVNAGVQRNLRLVKNPRIKANDINGVKTWPISDFSVNGYRAIQQIKDDMRRASGATEGIQGASVKGEQSATEFAAIQQQAGVRLKNKIKMTDDLLFKPFVERSYRYAMQFASRTKVVRVLGKKGVKWQPVNPEDIWGTFDIVTKGPTEVENSVIKTNKLIQFLSIAARVPQAANIPFLLQEIWTALGMSPSDKHKVILAGANETEDDVQTEIETLIMGQDVPVKPNQDHQLHIQMKSDAYAVIRQNGGANQENTDAFRKNIDTHAQMMTNQGQDSRALGGQGGVPVENIEANESPNPMEENLGPSTQGTGAFSI